MIPTAKPKLPSADALLTYLRQIDENRYYTNLGPLVRTFEKRFAGWVDIGEGDVVTASNGTAIMELAITALDLPPGNPAVRIERLRFYKSRPLSLTNLYLPPHLANRITEADIDDRPIMRILEATGIRAMRAEQTISAVAADDDAANKLSVSIGAPLIRLRRTVFDESGAPFEHQQGLYNPDQYEYHMLLTRDNSSSRPQWRHIG